MMDIKPPKPRRVPPPIPPLASPPPAPLSPPPPLKVPKSKFRWNSKWTLATAGTLVIAIIITAISWYFWALQPLNRESNERIRITVTSGDTSSVIATTLKKSKVIRSAVVFQIYAKLSATNSQLKAGSYTVSPSQSIPDIINHLVNGNTDELTITIPPGVSTLGIRDKLREYGYSDDEITKALQANYSSPLLADKPAGVSLDGYIFPETFHVNPNDSLESLFQRSFDELYSRLQRDNMIEKFKSRNLNIHQALTLASIIQKEESDPADQRQVAQVFFLRLQINMPLESDPTYEYAANQRGVEPTVTIDSPYNTRKYPGLPPGPIANMNYSAIEAVVNPAPGDYLYFVAGDDGITHFSHTLPEHLEKVKKYCHDLCN